MADCSDFFDAEQRSSGFQPAWFFPLIHSGSRAGASSYVSLATSCRRSERESANEQVIIANMGLLDSMVGRWFRTEKAGRVVVFPGARAYVVRCEADELKIRSFLKMFTAAHVSILILGYFLASEWSRELVYALGRPAGHIFRTMGIFIGIYSVVVLIPYILLWRSYKKALFSFVSAQDEVPASGRLVWPPQLSLIGMGLIALGILFLAGATWYIRHK